MFVRAVNTKSGKNQKHGEKKRRAEKHEETNRRVGVVKEDS
jgi:hypothetical protein